MAEMAPMNKPSNNAYSGASTGAQLGLKLIANAEINPPMIPTHIKVVMVSCFSCSYKFQLYAAPAINISIMNPNLLIAPLTVMVPILLAAISWLLSNIFSVRVGLPDLKIAIVKFFLFQIYYKQISFQGVLAVL